MNFKLTRTIVYIMNIQFGGFLQLSTTVLGGVHGIKHRVMSIYPRPNPHWNMQNSKPEYPLIFIHTNDDHCHGESDNYKDSGRFPNSVWRPWLLHTRAGKLLCRF